LALSLAGLVAARSAFGQASVQPRFEVATVKPTTFDILKAKQAIAAGATVRAGKNVHGDRVEYIAMNLGQLICDAYDLTPDQVVGLDGSYNARFDIVAKLPAGFLKEDLNLMLQDLLAERFQLAAHREIREQRVLALVVGKAGPKLKPTPPEDLQKRAEATPEGVTRSAGSKANGQLALTTRTGNSVIRYVTKDPSIANPPVHVEGDGMTMTGLSELLTQWRTGNRGLVVDATGLEGHFDISLDIRMSDMGSVQQTTNRIGAGGSAMASNPADAASDPSGESLTQSLRRLGLDLVARRLPVTLLIIDHIEKVPTAN